MSEEYKMPVLARFQEIWREECKKRAEMEAEDQRLAAAMLGRLISMGVEDPGQARRGAQALVVILQEIELIATGKEDVGLTATEAAGKSMRQALCNSCRNAEECVSRPFKGWCVMWQEKEG